MKCSRRQVLVGFFGLAAGGSVAARLAARSGGGAAAATAAGSFPELPFSPEHKRALLAAMEHFLPGALDAGAHRHIAWWIANNRYFKNFAKELQEGAKMLDRASEEQHKKPFAECSSEQKDAVFKKLVSGQARTPSFDGGAFMTRLANLTLEGFLADPKYGGNRDQVGWKFIGFKPCWWAPRAREVPGGKKRHEHG